MIPTKLVLASSSPRREELLEQLDLNFTIVPSKIEEDKFYNLSPEILVKQLASAKAEAVAELVEDTIVIAADTIVVYKDEILGKPDNTDDARKMLNKLKGSKHRVLSGLVVLSTIENEMLVDYDETEVFMRNLDENEINGYINSGEPFDKAGAYGIQGLGGIFIEKIRGSYYTVVGLPIHKLAVMLKKFSIEILSTA